MQRLDLTHVGRFTERAEALLRAILRTKGGAELSSGIGIIPKKNKIGIMVSFNDDFATVFLPSEARALAEIITDTNKEEDPYSRAAGEILDHLVSDLIALAEEAEQLERNMALSGATETKH